MAVTSESPLIASIVRVIPADDSTLLEGEIERPYIELVSLIFEKRISEEVAITELLASIKEALRTLFS